MGRTKHQCLMLGSMIATLLTAPWTRATAEETSRPGRVEGVLKIGGKPTLAAEVILQPNHPPPLRDKKRPGLGPRTQTDRRGRFVFENVEPGEWRVGLFKKN